MHLRVWSDGEAVGASGGRAVPAKQEYLRSEADEERAPHAEWVSAQREAARTAVRRRSPWDIAKSEFMVEEVVVEARED